jgi:hypothetical protein
MAWFSLDYRLRKTDDCFTQRRRLMMNSQTQLFHGGTFQMRSGDATHLGRLGGDLTVVEGSLWLTRDGDLGDHVFEAGQRVRLGVDENAVIEPARTGETVSLRWQPRRRSFAGAVLAEPLRGLAFLAGVAARGFAALARRAADGACRAQGAINGGDATASPCAMK